MKPENKLLDTVSEHTFEKQFSASWNRADNWNFLYNNALRFCLEGSWIFLNVNLPRNKELEIGKELAYSERYTCVLYYQKLVNPKNRHPDKVSEHIFGK